jgi:ring-1,2-phenylacetyl-CoA epoxidase subunit PaaD
MEWLEEVKDPEIPVVSLVDLGVITDVIIEDSNVLVKMTPTFAGCPAMDYMRKDVVEVLQAKGIEQVATEVSFKTPWSSNNISEKGRKALKTFGLAPPQKHEAIIDIDMLEQTACPYCDSTNTELNSPFGPTLCRAMHYCNNCKQAFEQFKPL